MWWQGDVVARDTVARDEVARDSWPIFIVGRGQLPWRSDVLSLSLQELPSPYPAWLPDNPIVRLLQNDPIQNVFDVDDRIICKFYLADCFLSGPAYLSTGGGGEGVG